MVVIMWLYELTFFISSIYLEYRNNFFKLSEELFRIRAIGVYFFGALHCLVKYSVAGNDGKEAGDNAQLILTPSFK